MVRYWSAVAVVFVTISLKYEKAWDTGTVNVLSRLAVQVGRSDTACRETHVVPSLDPASTNDLGARVGLRLHAKMLNEPRVCRTVDWSCSHSPRMVFPSTTVLYVPVYAPTPPPEYGLVLVVNWSTVPPADAIFENARQGASLEGA
jgi:hypothetical protein